MSADEAHYVTAKFAAKKIADKLNRPNAESIRVGISDGTYDRGGLLKLHSVPTRRGDSTVRRVLASSLEDHLRELETRALATTEAIHPVEQLVVAPSDVKRESEVDVRDALRRLDKQVQELADQYTFERKRNAATQRVIRRLLASLAGDEDRPS